MSRLAVRREAGESLVATTTAYGVAPSDLVKCAACGHVQVAEFPAKARLDEAYSDVDEAAYLEEEKGQRATADRALDQIERHVAAGSIADLGCWLGFLLSQAEKRGWKGEGVEPSRFAANFARERLNLSVRTGTLESADLPRGGFDAVVMADVIEHLPDPGEALERTAGMLRAGGVVYLALPDAGSAVARLMASAGLRRRP